MIKTKFAAKVFAVLVALSCPRTRAELVTTYQELTNTLAVATAGDTIKIAAGTFPLEGAFTVSTGVTLSGGWTTETERASGAVTTFDGGGTNDLLTVDNTTGTVTLDSIRFYRALTRGCTKTGAGNLSFTKCIFEANGPTVSPGYGLGLKAEGADAAIVSLADCSFVSNVVSWLSYGRAMQGNGIYAKSCARVILDRTDFTANGIALETPDNWELAGGFQTGVAIYADSAPVVARSCSFRANRGYRYGNSDDGGATVDLRGNASGSAFTNCLFVANQTYLQSKQNLTHPEFGALLFKPSSTDDTLSLDRCTFAYNISGAVKGSGGVNVIKGRATVRNSIFYGNIQGIQCGRRRGPAGRGERFGGRRLVALHGERRLVRRRRDAGRGQFLRQRRTRDADRDRERAHRGGGERDTVRYDRPCDAPRL